MQIQLDIPEEISDKLAIYKIQNKLKNKKEVIIKLLTEVLN